MTVWEVSCAVLILAALALRSFFRKHLSARARYALWAIVLLRLLLPVSIGQARVSVPGALEKINSYLGDGDQVTPLRDPFSFGGGRADDDHVTERKTAAITGQPGNELPEVIPSAEPEKPVQADSPVSVPWTEAVLVVWITGAAAVMLWFALVNLRFARTLRRGRTRMEPEAPLPVYEAPGAETPCLFGLFRPAVYLPPEVAADEALCRYVVAHELTHFRHGDHIWSALRCLCVALHWWDPLVWAAAACARRDAELACDEGTLVRLGAAHRRPYGEALIRMTVPDKAYLLRAATMMSGADLKERIKMIAQNRKTVRAALIAVAALLVLAAAFVFAGSSGGNRLFDRAAPNRSAMTLYRLDENGGKVWNLYDSTKEKEILSRLKKVSAHPAQYRIPDQLVYPLYGLEVGTRDGNTIRVLWNDGYLIDWKGIVYSFDFPFESLKTNDWQYISSVESVAELPNGAMLAQTGEQWFAARLTPAREPVPAPPEGVEMTVAQVADQAVMVTIENRGSGSWDYGDAYSFDVLLDGKWYQVPMRPGDRNLAFTGVGWTIEPGKTVERVCSLSHYAPLPPGVYRVVKNGLTAPFTLRADGTGTPGEALPLNPVSDPARTSEAVFKIDNISSITFFSQNPNEAPAAVPEAYMDEIKAWLEAFRRGEPVDEARGAAPGADSVSVQIDYDDGAILKNSLGTISVDGTLYYLLSPPKPACWSALWTHPATAEDLRTLQQEDLARYAALIQAWNAEVDMIGEAFVSEVGEEGNWRDIPSAFASRWCEKYLNASVDSPYRCADAGVWALGDYMNAVSLSVAPGTLAFNVTLALGFPAEQEELFAFATMGWARKNENGLMEISTEAVLQSSDGIHWVVEGMNSGGSAGWGFRELYDSERTGECIRYALENKEPDILLHYLPNLNWGELSDGELKTAMELLQAAAVSDDPSYFDGQDQLIRDLYMLWGLKRSDGAFAEMYLDGPNCILARQKRADPDAFAAALREMDARTIELVDRSTWDW